MNKISRSSKATLFFGLTVTILAGLWFDLVSILNQPQLFIAFQVISLTGIALGVFLSQDWLSSNKNKTLISHGHLKKILLVLAAIVVWRISYFPIMVFAGWVATLGERLIVAMSAAVSLPIVIYPIFFLCMLFMFAGATLAMGAIVYQKYRAAMMITVPAFVMASMVSFSKPSDMVLLPDTHVTVSEPLPTAMLPIENPYLPLLHKPEYPLQKKMLLFAAGSIYVFVPHSPWGGTVKGTLEDLFRNNPNGSTSIRIRDHYESYHVAHKLIRS